MQKEMLINVSEGEECRIALLEDGRLEELYMERTSSASHVGNVYKGRVMNVEPSIQAAFIDFGIGRNGFLHISDVMPTYFGRRGENVRETVGRKMARRDRPPIQQCLRRGDEITVQIIKEGIGTKGPTLSSYVSIPGRILVMMPGVGKSGVSRKIEDEVERKRLRKILDELDPPRELGFIIRTNGIDKSKQEIERDLKYLLRLWETIDKKNQERGPVELYAEGDLIMRTVRDVYAADVDRIVIDNKVVAKRVSDFFKLMMPRSKSKVEFYEDHTPLFHRYNIEHAIEQMHSKRVPLPSGGSLIIDQTEAVVAIDVNSGKFREHSDAETTAFQTDLEAADEIPRQLRLRDLGGVVICDFIDLRFERHRRELEARLAENLKKDRSKTRFLQMSEFGIIEMTRQRMRPSLKRSIYHDCLQCGGTGLVKTNESIGLDAVRKLALAAADERVVKIDLHIAMEAALHVLNRKRAAISEIEQRSGKPIRIVADATLAGDQLKFVLSDDRDTNVYLEVLDMSPEGEMARGKTEVKRRGRDRGRDGGRDKARDSGRDQRGGRSAREDFDDNPRGEMSERDDGDERDNDVRGELDRDIDRDTTQDSRDSSRSRPATKTDRDSDDRDQDGAGQGSDEGSDEGSGQGSEQGSRRRRRRGRGRSDSQAERTAPPARPAPPKINASGERVYETVGEYDVDPREFETDDDIDNPDQNQRDARRQGGRDQRNAPRNDVRNDQRGDQRNDQRRQGQQPPREQRPKESTSGRSGDRSGRSSNESASTNSGPKGNEPLFRVKRPDSQALPAAELPGGEKPLFRIRPVERQAIVFPQLGDFKPQPTALRGPKVIREDPIDLPNSESRSEVDDDFDDDLEDRGEAGDQASDRGDEASNEASADGEAEGGPRRKRRRRGRRGRGGKGAAVDAGPAPVEVSAVRDSGSDDLEDEEDDEQDVEDRIESLENRIESESPEISNDDSGIVLLGDVADDDDVEDLDEVDSEAFPAVLPEVVKLTKTRRKAPTKAGTKEKVVAEKSATDDAAPAKSSSRRGAPKAIKKERKPAKEKQSDKDIELAPVVPTGSSDRHYVETDLPPVDFGKFTMSDLDSVPDDDDFDS